MTIKEGSVVKVDYTGKFTDGNIFDSSEKHGKPLEFQIGAGQVIPGFEDAIKEMSVGDEKEINLKATEAYGERNDELLKKVPRENLPPTPDPEVGMVLGVGAPDGRQFPATITEVSEKEVTIDLNHPLAGKDLNFKLKLLDVKEGELKEVDESAGCGSGECGSGSCGSGNCGSDDSEDKPGEKKEGCCGNC